MKLGVLTVPLSSLTLKESLNYLAKLGVQTIELGCGGFPGTAHCDPTILLSDPSKLKEFKSLIRESEMEISALSCHGNAVHPDPSVAAAAHQAFAQAVRLASELDVSVVNTFSGCPGDSKNSQFPNWVTCSWPDDFEKILDYQWNECLLPYWQDASAFAKASGIKVAFEMHPGFCVYNTATLLRIRREVGDTLGANFDPSHLFWQGMNAASVIKELNQAIFHVHAKDCFISDLNTGRNGVLDTRHYSQTLERSWTFRTVGYGHDEQTWKNIISALRMIQYDGAISIEHEDVLMSPKEGLEKAIQFLKPILIYEKAAEMWWA